MKRFTANYCRSNSNFIITNLPDYLKMNPYTNLIRIVQNLLTRGNPTIASAFIRKELQLNRNYLDKLEETVFLSNDDLNWTKTIKGDISRADYPAYEFYNDLSSILKSVGFITNLTIAECMIQDILPEVSDAFHNQQVDFYIPLLKTVIEVDGSGHQDRVQKELDKERNKLFERNAIRVIRISTDEIRSKSYESFKVEFRKVYQDHKVAINLYSRALKVSHKQIETQVLLTSIARVQVLVLELLDRGVISLDDRIWRFNILAKDAERYLTLALKDLEEWFGHVAALLNIPISLPKIQVNVFEKVTDFPFHQKQINIDFDLFKRWDDTVVQGNVYVIRTDFYDDASYFTMKINEPIIYKIGVKSHRIHLEFISNNLFGYPKFKKGQIEIIVNSLNGEDTIGLLPTGGGKSLTYQICTLLQPAISFVVAPIKSLMLDQIRGMKNKHHITHAAFINSDLSPEETDRTLRHFTAGRYFFIIISPERFQQQKFRNELSLINRTKAVAIATIDEVHCISEWGHDFRTSYLALANTIRRFTPSARFLALTATASSKVLKDIMTELKIESHNVLTISNFKREELTFDIQSVTKKTRPQELFELLGTSSLLSESDVGPTIVFTPVVNGENGCYELSHSISKNTKLKTGFYSGSKPKKFVVPNYNNYKEKIQESFMDDEINVLVSTKAFGMGVDKSNIQRTIHYGMPNSLESFYQEAGRAGRGGEKSKCFILYCPDVLDEKEIGDIFGTNTDLNKLKGYQNRMKGDLGTSLFFLKNSLMDIQAEADELFEFYQKSFMIGEDMTDISCFNEQEMQKKERFIYRLALIGVVEDWTIDWGKRRIEVELNDWTEQSVIATLERHIQKYDYSFTLDSKESTSDDFFEMITHFHNSEEPFLKRILYVLLKWYNDNVSYSRKRSLLLMKEYADEFTDSETLQNKIETYFKRNNDVYFLEKIVANEDNLQEWYKIFFIEEEGKELQPRSTTSFKSLSITCSRFLESYNQDPALNLISGMLELQQEKFDTIDGKKRMASAVSIIAKLDAVPRKNMLTSILHTFNSYYDYEKQKLLSEVLISNGFNKMDDLKEIHVNLEDTFSFGHMIKTLHTTVKHQKVGGYPWEI
ncbi:RecQ family ATP-dependent DNA helicase [Sporosarcina sp. FSL K6-5500]|uniref:RecQ family ATP-dependent DNA helicase n=1 Tax=Sporosarcina sp. FSL K6-5500 TaxID=2921558 RepID=UPI0030F5029B